MTANANNAAASAADATTGAGAGAVRYIDGIRLALDEALGTDPSVVVLGQDVSSGGPFGATAGLAARHGAARVRDTPISEGAIAGMAVGAALLGKRPVLELMFIDFITLAMDQLVNHAAKLRYMSGGQLAVPLTMRVQGGAMGGYGAHHSQSLEAWLTHVPGLKVLAPSTPTDAKAMLSAAIADDDPVVVLEHRSLYWARAPLDDAGAPAVTTAAVRRPGTDATIVSWSHMVTVALEAAEVLAADGIDVEVVDLRSLLPLDIDTVVESVRSTGRLLVASEAVEIGGLGAEVAAQVAVAADGLLRTPVRRVGAPFVPVPAAAHLEQAFVPSAATIADAVRALVQNGASS